MYNDVPFTVVNLASPVFGGAFAGYDVEEAEQAWAFEQRLSNALSYVFVVGPDAPKNLYVADGKVLILLHP